MSLDVVCFGALNMDKLYRVNRIAREEEESVIGSFKESPGGSAANTAVGLARLGIKTGYIGKVSNDREGKLLLDNFKTEGVDTRGVIVSKEDRSGVVIGFVDGKGERALYVDPSINDTIELKEINLFEKTHTINLKGGESKTVLEHDSAITTGELHLVFPEAHVFMTTFDEPIYIFSWTEGSESYRANKRVILTPF